jgi:proline dehydrogenase
MMSLPLARRAARRFVVGEKLDEAIEAVRQMNREGLLATLDHLGEDVMTPQGARASTEEALGILEAIERSGVQSNLSVKLTQLGLRVDESLCRENLRAILERAAPRRIFVRIDMEGSDVTEVTLRMFESLHDRYPNVGVVVQAYLRRTESDLRDRLIPRGASIRLCKGAYREPPGVAFPEKRDVDANYRRLADRLLSAETRGLGVRTAIATHDEAIVGHVLEKVRTEGLKKPDFEFQMLYGIRRDLQRRLAAEGFVVRIYTSYGKEWYPYFMRRLAERPANVFFLLRNIVRG